MRMLDCETPFVALESVSKILGVEANTLLTLFDTFDLEKYLEVHTDVFDAAEVVLWRRAVQSLNIVERDMHYDAVCWFHITRVLSPERFQIGIIPLGRVIDDLWNMLFGVANGHCSELDWQKFRDDLEKGIGGSHAGLYEMKIREVSQWGPHAILVRDTAFLAAAGRSRSHDYLGAPEIIEDICWSARERFGWDMLEEYRKRTRPCIVKFFDSDTDMKYVRTALHYLYLVHWRGPGQVDHSYGFSAEAEAVPSTCILKIQMDPRIPDWLSPAPWEQTCDNLKWFSYGT